MNTPTKSPARGGVDAKADSSVSKANESDIYNIDTDADISINQTADSTANELNENSQKIIHPKSVPAINPTAEELKYRESVTIDVTSDHYIKFLRCTGALCKQVSLKNAIFKGKQVLTHPLLGTLFCKICKNYYEDGEFSMDEDNEDKYCRWCGQGGTLYICSRCVYGFCPRCITRHFGNAKTKEVKNNDNWLCFYCNPTPLWELRAIAAAAVDFCKNKKAERLASKGKRDSKLDDSNFEKNCIVENSNDEVDEEEESKSKVNGTPKKSLLADPELPSQSSKPSESTLDTTEQNDSDNSSNILLRKRKSTNVPSDNETDPKVKKLKISVNAVIPETPEVSSNNSIDSSESGIENESLSECALTIKNAKLNLKGMFKITQMTANLCNSICKKRIHNLKHVHTFNEFRKEYEKITRMHKALSENLNDLMKTSEVLEKELVETFKKVNGHNSK